MPSAFAAALLLATLAGVPLAPSASGQVNTCTAPSDGGNWTVQGVVTCQGVTIRARNILIPLGGFLTLRDCTVIIQPARTADYQGGDGILATDTGSLDVGNCEVRVDDLARRAILQVAPAGALTFRGSTLRGFRDVGAGGSVQGNEPPVTIEDSRFLDLAYGIFLFDRSNVHIAGNLFSNVTWGVIHTWGSPVIEDNVFTRCSDALDFTNGATPVVRGNTITACQAGIVQPSNENTTQEIHGNDIYGNLLHSDQVATFDAYFRGDGQDNWWGSDPPDPARVLVTHYDPWRAAPVHPERLPTPSFTATARDGLGSFDASASLPSSAFGYGLSAYEWDFGDGATGSGAQAQHAYLGAGNYTVRLRVVDSYGLSRDATALLNVTLPPSRPASNPAPSAGPQPDPEGGGSSSSPSPSPTPPAAATPRPSPRPADAPRDPGPGQESQATAHQAPPTFTYRSQAESPAKASPALPLAAVAAAVGAAGWLRRRLR